MKKWLQQRLVQVERVNKLRFIKMVVIGLGLSGGICVVMGVWLNSLYTERIYPGVSLSGFVLSHQRIEEAKKTVDILQRDFLANNHLEVVVTDTEFASPSGQPRLIIPFEEIGLRYDSLQTVDNAYKIGRDRGWWQNIKTRWNVAIGGISISHSYWMNEEVFSEKIKNFAEEVNKPGAKPEVELVEIDKGVIVEISLGENGKVIDNDNLIKSIKYVLANLEWLQIEAPIITEANKVAQLQAEVTKKRAELLLDKKLTLVVDEGDQKWNLEPAEMVGFLDFSGGFDVEKLKVYVSNIAEAVNREPENAAFKFEDGRVIEFKPSRNGIVVDENQSVFRLQNGLAGLENGVDIPVKLAVISIPPRITTPDVNNLGIKELLGKGESTFKGSIPGRVHNVALTASRLHGVLIPQGEVFSFNKTIGDVSKATGYKTAYVIQDGRTVLGDGGGVCQDSTTLFRAVLDAGLPIVERKAHSYRVGYYEQNSEPGYDATVFAPSTDFRFTNDTDAHVLIQAITDTSNMTLTIELYGTSDGRESEIRNYQRWGAVPAPPPLYQDDPTLPKGVVKQVDWAAPGLKTKFDYIVTKNGSTLFEKTFYSTYRPWQAIFLKGAG